MSSLEFPVPFGIYLCSCEAGKKNKREDEAEDAKEAATSECVFHGCMNSVTDRRGTSESEAVIFDQLLNSCQFFSLLHPSLAKCDVST